MELCIHFEVWSSFSDRDYFTHSSWPTAFFLFWYHRPLGTFVSQLNSILGPKTANTDTYFAIFNLSCPSLSQYLANFSLKLAMAVLFPGYRLISRNPLDLRTLAVSGELCKSRNFWICEPNTFSSPKSNYFP